MSSIKKKTRKRKKRKNKIGRRCKSKSKSKSNFINFVIWDNNPASLTITITLILASLFMHDPGTAFPEKEINVGIPTELP